MEVPSHLRDFMWQRGSLEQRQNTSPRTAHGGLHLATLVSGTRMHYSAPTSVNNITEYKAKQLSNGTIEKSNRWRILCKISSITMI